MSAQFPAPCAARGRWPLVGAWLLALGCSGLLAGCGYTGRVSGVFAPAAGPGPRRPENEQVDHLLDAIGYDRRGAGRDVVQMTEARLHQRLSDLLALPGAWLARMREAEWQLQSGGALAEMRRRELGRPRPEPEDARRERWERELGSGDAVVRAGALGRIDAPTADIDVDLLRAQLTDARADIRLEAARALARTGARAALPTLRRQLAAERDPLARREQLAALAALDASAGQAAARELSASAASPWVRARACRLLAAAPTEGDVAVLIERLVADPEFYVRDVAAEVLAQITGVDVAAPSDSGVAPPPELVARLRAWRPTGRAPDPR